MWVRSCYLSLLIFLYVWSAYCAPSAKNKKIADALISNSSDVTFAKINVNNTFRFVQNPGMWSSIPKLLAKAGMKNSTLKICIVGPWLLYSHPDYLANTLKAVQIISGDEKCFKPPKLIGSMQPLSKYGLTDNSFSLFEEPYFSSIGQTHAPNGSELARLRWPGLPTLRSLITTGKQAWTLFDYNGKAVCLKPKSSMKKPICFIPDTFQEGLDLYKFATGVAGCGDNTAGYDKIVELTNCKEYGSASAPEEIPEGKKENPNLKPDVEMDMSDDKEVKANEGMNSNYTKALERFCKPESHYLDEQPLNEDFVRQFSSLRFYHDFLNPTQLLWPERQEDIWKTELLDTIYDIAIMSLPDELVPTIYLKTIRELTLYHLDAVWKNSKANLTVTDFEISKVLDQLEKCTAIVIDSSDKIEDILLSIFLSIRNPNDLSLGLRYDFRQDRKLDHVIETTWLIANYVYSMCHHMLESNVDFWMDYVKVVQDMYFKPLVPRWQNATISLRSYSAIFGGLGVKGIWQRLALAVTAAFDQTELLPPFARAFTMVKKQ